jgi:formamidopyrimidine-DNA glycosylase
VFALRDTLRGSRIRNIDRRGKYLVFDLERDGHGRVPVQLLGHLGMSGRLCLLPRETPAPRHSVVEIILDTARLIFEDPRGFGRLTLDLRPLESLGPEPLGARFTTESFRRALRRSRQAIKLLLLNQTVAAGVGNIYASEALFRARIHPATPAMRLRHPQVAALRRSIRAVLRDAIAWGSTVPLNWSGVGSSDRLFYFGRDPSAQDRSEERLRVYDRAGQPCPRCRTALRRLIQGARSTFFCPACQRR